mmetsp:Transcript_35146/g.64664  ORF Transcript_35146/g.64664 Transcript_35146/m.64664 type:complete len:217 (-) Transcript_35146:649-1299(-)
MTSWDRAVTASRHWPTPFFTRRHIPFPISHGATDVFFRIKNIAGDLVHRGSKGRRSIELLKSDKSHIFDPQGGKGVNHKKEKGGTSARKSEFCPSGRDVLPRAAAFSIERLPVWCSGHNPSSTPPGGTDRQPNIPNRRRSGRQRDCDDYDDDEPVPTERRLHFVPTLLARESQCPAAAAAASSFPRKASTGCLMKEDDDDKRERERAACQSSTMPS